MADRGQRWRSLLTVVVALLVVALAAVAPTAGASCEELALVPECAPEQPEQVGDDTTSTTPGGDTRTTSTSTTSTTSTSSTTTTEPPESAPTSEEASAELLELMNDERTERGVAPQARRGDVEEIAADHSAAMAAGGELRHNDAYFSKENRRRLDARRLGENVAVGPSIGAIHEALMASDGHRANVIDARFTVVGLGAVFDGERWWVTQDFVQPRH